MIVKSYGFSCHEKFISDMETASFELSARTAGEAASVERCNFVFAVGGGINLWALQCLHRSQQETMS